MDIYKIYRFFWDFCFSNPEKIKPTHIAIFSFAVEHCNRLGWKTKFGFPTTMVMEATGIKSYSVYKKHFDDLHNFGLIDVIEFSKNQFSSNVIALKENYKANDKALDKALVKHLSKQSESSCESTHQSTSESISTVDIQLTINNKPITIEVEESLPNLNLPTSPFISQYEIITVDKFVEYSLTDESWLNSICEQTRYQDPKKFLPIFATWRKNSKKETATLNDFAKHFSLWIGGAIEREKETLKNATNGRDFKNTAQQLREINKTNPNRHPSASGSEDGGYGER